jgi:hypothetical protein
MSQEEAATEAARVLGFRRPSPQVRKLMCDVVKQMMDEQLLYTRNQKLYVAAVQGG